MISNPVCLDDFERHAASVLPKMAFDFFRSGANSESTVAYNRQAFDRLVLRPRMLRDVSQQDISTTILGRKSPFPFGIAPTSMQCLAHPEGELATARAACDVDALMVLSTSSTTRLEDVAAAGGENSHRWFQLYVFKDRELTRQLIRRAESAGFSALVLTVDTAVGAIRYANFRNKLSLPSHLRYMNLTDIEGMSSFSTDSSDLYEFLNDMIDSSLTWKDVKWLMSFTRLPVLVKGILTAEDARIAADLGVAGIIVSNHGGRQLDSTAASIEALPEVVRAVGERACPVFLDGGVRSGTDVVKALLLGARAVFLGRPVVWALAHSGEEGVKKMLRILEQEVRVAMALMGARSLSDLEPSMIALRDTLPKL